MLATELQGFIDAINGDDDYREARRDLHESYEWLEGYWIDNYGRHGMEPFCDRFGDYYWRIQDLREFAWKLARQGCVGKSDDNYEPTGEVISATMYLLLRAGIGDEQGFPGCRRMDCIKVRCHWELCDAEQRADAWNRSAFKAVMYIVRQVRNNLFHGRKLELMKRQYERNRQLVATSGKITALLLDHLVEAERQSI